MLYRRDLSRRLSYFSLAATLGLMAACACGTAQAQLLWYDGFDTGPGGYVVGEDGTPDLAGQSGGSGPGTPFFSGPWVAADYPASPPDNTKVFSESLSRPGQPIPSIGGSAANTQHFECCWEQRTSRLMTEPWAAFTDPDGTFYMSFLMDFGKGLGADAHHRMFEMHLGGFEDNPNRQLMLGISKFAFDFHPRLERWLLLSVEDSSTVDDTDGVTEALVVNGHHVWLDGLERQGAHFMVLKFEMSTTGNDVISAFLDPVGSVEPAPNAQVSVGQFLADRISAMVQFEYTGQGTSGAFDELRVGTTFASVANNTLAYAPEPASLSLLGLGLVGCGFVRRKRS